MIAFGEVVTLENNKEYICFSVLRHEEKDYVLLMSNFKPLEVRFAQQTDTPVGTQLTMVEDAGVRQALFALFQQKKEEGKADG